MVSKHGRGRQREVIVGEEQRRVGFVEEQGGECVVSQAIVC